MRTYKASIYFIISSVSYEFQASFSASLNVRTNFAPINKGRSCNTGLLDIRVWQVRVFTEFIKSEFLGQNRSGVSSLLLFFLLKFIVAFYYPWKKKLSEVSKDSYK